ncbi:MAG: serine/threonine protein kinase [Polyangiales bacterium]|jgi:serine/threonine protein kinase
MKPRACAACGTRNVGSTGRCAGCGSNLRLDPEVSNLLGEEVGGHLLTKLLGRGAMGSVYATGDAESGLALKVLHPHVAGDALRVKRFHREAKAASGLAHSSIVRLFEFGHDDAHGPFIVMERLEGENLVERTTRSALTPLETVQVFDQVLSALAHAHEHGIVHRDLKAENVVVHEGVDGLVAKVCDFGMVKMLNEDGTAITAEGLVCGTPEYMSPEQARGEELDARADIYALGCLLFLVLTGRLPFRGKNAVDTLGQHLARPVPSARKACPERRIPAHLDAVARIAMAKAPSARYQSAGEMRDAILGADAPDKEKQHGRLFAVLLLALAVMLGWALTRQ